MKKKIIIGVLVLLLIVILFFAFGSKHDKAATSVVDNVILLNSSDVTTVKLGNVDDIVAFTGELSALNQSVISSEVDAVVKKVLVQEGQFVKQNQVLAILDNTDLQQAVSQQQAVLSTAKARFELDKKKLEKQKALFDEGFISKIAYDELQTNYQASKEGINQQEAQLARAKKQLSDTVIRAPFDGYLYQKNIDNGQLAAKNTKLFALASLDNLQIKAAIPSNLINKIKSGQNVLFSIETNLQQYPGKVQRINPVAETGTRSYYIYIDFNNKVAKLNAGQFVKGQIAISTLTNVTYISRDAIRKLNDGNYVFVLQKGTVIKKPIKVLLENRLLNTAAISGINEGDTVLLANVLTIKAGDRAKIVD